MKYPWISKKGRGKNILQILALLVAVQYPSIKMPPSSPKLHKIKGKLTFVSLQRRMVMQGDARSFGAAIKSVWPRLIGVHLFDAISRNLQAFQLL